MAVSKKFNKGKREKLASGAVLARRGRDTAEARKKAEDSMEALWAAFEAAEVPAEAHAELLAETKARTRRELARKRRKGAGA